MHPALDVAELHDGQHDHDGHQDRRLGRRSAEILGLEAVVPDLVDQDFGGLGRTAAGGGVDDAEGLEEGVGHVDDRSKERRVGTECVSTCRSRWSQYNYTTQTNYTDTS